MPKVLNFIALQLCWLVCVILAGRDGMTWAALLATLLFVGVHFVNTPCPRADLKLIGGGLLIGLVLDSLWSATGIISYQQQTLFPLAPVWIACLWVAFLLTFNHSLAWMQRHLWLAGVLSAVSSPLSYYTADRLGALQIQEPLLGGILLALSWGMLVPGLLLLASRWSQHEEAAKHAVV